MSSVSLSWTSLRNLQKEQKKRKSLKLMILNITETKEPKWKISFWHFLSFFKLDHNHMEGKGLSQGTGTQIKGWALERVNPGFSSMSTVSLPPLTFHSKHWIIAARFVCTTCKASEVPGHPLLPLPNGIRWKCCPLTSKSLFKLPSSPRNLSGENSCGFSQCLGSRLTALVLMKTRVFAGTRYGAVLEQFPGDERASRVKP